MSRLGQHAYKKLMKKRQNEKLERFKRYRKKVSTLPTPDVPEETFLVSEYNDIRIVDNPSDYQLPTGITGYAVEQTCSEDLPRYVISYREAQHLADVVALVRHDDPEINVSNAIRHYLGSIFRLDKLGLSKQDLEKMDRATLIKYMAVFKAWKGTEMIDVIRRERNLMAVERSTKNKDDAGYLNVVKNGVLCSVYVTNPAVHDKPLAGPLPVLVNATSTYYSGERDNGPPSYELSRCYGKITFPILMISKIF